MKFPWFLCSFVGLVWLQSLAAIAEPIPPSPAPSATPIPPPPAVETVEPTVSPTPTPSPSPTPSPTPTPSPDPARSPVPRKRPIVVIDPGHGGPDPGAVGIGGIFEKEIVLDISLQVAQLLENQGIQTILTRKTDIDLGLQPRVAIANRARATVFVSIHANAISMSRPDVNGIETYHIAGSARGRQLAESIQRQLLAATGMRDRGVKRARFYVLVHTTMPAVLVEVGFVTGRDDVPRLRDPATRTQMAQAIVQGIMDYLQKHPVP